MEQSESGKAIRVERLVAASPAQVYRAFTHSTGLREWLCDFATTVARQGGRFYVAWNEGYYAAGAFTDLVENAAVEFTWMGRDEPGQTRVRVTLEEQGSVTHVTLVHSGFSGDAAWEKHTGEIERGWVRGLDNLVSVLGSGPDLRITRRPMMGIIFNDFNPDIAQKIGVPVTEGTRVEGTIDGLGAQLAGLRRDDVIVSFNGQPIKQFEDFGSVMGGLHAGDRVRVGFYRGNELKEAEMELAQRPLPEFPETATSLAAALQTHYDRQWAELEKTLAGVTEEEANFHPGAQEWSVKEVLTHLILEERARNETIYENATGFERVTDAFGEPFFERVQAAAASFPTLGDVVAEFRRAMADTVRLVESFPERVAANKGTFWRIAFNTLTDNFHMEDHREQIANAIKAARA